jgi:S1-C subfamily serine protease
VGINTAIFSRSGGSIGIGFAIPVNMVKAVRVSARGVVVLDVRGGPARRFGFRQGDVLTEVNGVTIETVASLSQILDRRGNGLWDIAVERGGRLLRVQVSG